MVTVRKRVKQVERLLIRPATIVSETAAFVAIILLALVVGVERVLYSWYFIACAAVCLLSLATATLGMIARDVRVSRQRGRPRVRGGTVLHVGLVCALVFSAVALLGESQGIYAIFEGQTLPAGSAPITLVRGPLADAFALPEPLTLLHVSPSWWADGTLKQLSSELSLGNPARSLALAVNGSKTIHGVRYFQDQRFGPAYFLTLTSPDGSVQKQRVDLSQPGVGSPTYLDVTIGTDVVLRTRSEVVSTTSEATVLSVKIAHGGQESAVESLGVGTTKAVGDWSVRLDSTHTWAAYIISRQPSVWPLFASFLIVGVGAMMLYAAPMKPARAATVRVRGAEDDSVAP
ncbi:MAG: hypothetical protein LLG08_09445 [Actinomycetia bacterium]|nr:hypothetical protein [Actinomycetes bacterium]